VLLQGRFAFVNVHIGTDLVNRIKPIGLWISGPKKSLIEELYNYPQKLDQGLRWIRRLDR